MAGADSVETIVRFIIRRYSGKEMVNNLAAVTTDILQYLWALEDKDI